MGKLKIILLGSLLAATTQAASVNLDLQGDSASTYSEQGAYADSGNNFWNSSQDRMTTLVASDSLTATPLGVTISADSRHAFSLSNDLMADYAYAKDADITVGITGLVPGDSYDLYVYCQGDNLDQTAVVTLGSTTKSTTGDLSGNFVENGNFVVITATADASGEINGTVARNGSRYVAINGIQIVGDFSAAPAVFVHPGISHKQSDLERMKYMLETGEDPWMATYQLMEASSYSSYDYVLHGNSTNTVVDFNSLQHDGFAAYYNALMWNLTGDERHAQKCVEIFNAWVNVKEVPTTMSLYSGRSIWKMLEGAEIIKSTYAGWSTADMNKFKAMLVYPGYSSSVEPTAAISSKNVTFYWSMYNGDPVRHGNQGLFGMRGVMAMGIFLDNEVMYDRALRYLQGLPPREDDLPYAAGPPISSGIPQSSSNIYYDEFDVYDRGSIHPDMGYNEVMSHYIWENGQCQESSRDQAHGLGGVSIITEMCEMAWNQGDDLYGHLDDRPLLGLEFYFRYNLSYEHVYSDQLTPWEPTVESGEFIQRLDQSGRWKSLKINPYEGANITAADLNRGQHNLNPIYEMNLGHYRDRMNVDPSKYKWLERGFDVMTAALGVENDANGVDHPGWGGMKFRRVSPGDPIRGFSSNGLPIYSMNILPMTIEAENYDYFTVNGEEHTYHDLTSTNSGGQYRADEGVDITTCSEGGYALTDLEDGEWITYTVHVEEAGEYRLAVRYAGVAEGAIRFSFGTQDVTGDVILPATGSTNTWATTTVAEHIPLSKGVQSLRVTISGASRAYNLQSLIVTRTGDDLSSIHIEAEDHDAFSGTQVETCSDDGGGQNVSYISNGNWCQYDDVTLSGSSVLFSARVARPSGRPDSTLEVRLDSPTGTPIGSIDVPETGGWQEWDTIETELDPVEGTHSIVLVFVEAGTPTDAAMMNLNWIEFQAEESPVAPSGLAAAPLSATQIDLSWLPETRVSEYHLKRATVSGGPYTVLVNGPSATTYTDSGLLAGTNYYYVIRTVIQGVESADSAEVVAVPSAPLNEGDGVIGTVEISSDGAGGQRFELSVPNLELGHNAQVFTSASLMDPDWQPATDVMPGTGGAMLIEIPIQSAQTNLFYKLNVWRQ
jgi:hypothetical protein